MGKRCNTCGHNNLMEIMNCSKCGASLRYFHRNDEREGPHLVEEIADDNAYGSFIDSDDTAPLMPGSDTDFDFDNDD